MVTVVPRVFKSPITSFEANCACQTWITPTVEMMKVLTITKEFIQEVEAFSPFMRDYSTSGFYLAKFDKIGYQVCPSSSIVSKVWAKPESRILNSGYWGVLEKVHFSLFPLQWERYMSGNNLSKTLGKRLKQSCWNGQPSYEQLLRASYLKRTPGTRRLIMWARSSLCHYGNSCSESL